MWTPVVSDGEENVRSVRSHQRRGEEEQSKEPFHVRRINDATRRLHANTCFTICGFSDSLNNDYHK
jgi:hypothetical protein